jgi:hypothetical protein
MGWKEEQVVSAYFVSGDMVGISILEIPTIDLLFSIAQEFSQLDLRFPRRLLPMNVAIRSISFSGITP